MSCLRGHSSKWAKSETTMMEWSRRETSLVSVWLGKRPEGRARGGEVFIHLPLRPPTTTGPGFTWAGGSLHPPSPRSGARLRRTHLALRHPPRLPSRPASAYATPQLGSSTDTTSPLSTTRAHPLWSSASARLKDDDPLWAAIIRSSEPRRARCGVQRSQVCIGRVHCVCGERGECVLRSSAERIG